MKFLDEVSWGRGLHTFYRSDWTRNLGEHRENTNKFTVDVAAESTALSSDKGSGKQMGLLAGTTDIKTTLQAAVYKTKITLLMQVAVTASHKLFLILLIVPL